MCYHNTKTQNKVFVLCHNTKMVVSQNIFCVITARLTQNKIYFVLFRIITTQNKINLFCVDQQITQNRFIFMKNHHEFDDFIIKFMMKEDFS